MDSWHHNFNGSASAVSDRADLAAKTGKTPGEIAALRFVSTWILMLEDQLPHGVIVTARGKDGPNGVSLTLNINGIEVVTPKPAIAITDANDH